MELLPFDCDMHDRLNETLAEVAKQGYDVTPPTQAQWWRIDELAEVFNRPKYLTVRNAVYALGADVIREEKSGILNWIAKGARDFECDVAERMAQTGETQEQATEYLQTMMQMAVVRELDKMRESNPSTYDAAMTTLRRMFEEFGRPVPYPFN